MFLMTQQHFDRTAVIDTLTYYKSRYSLVYYPYDTGWAILRDGRLARFDKNMIRLFVIWGKFKLSIGIRAVL